MYNKVDEKMAPYISHCQTNQIPIAGIFERIRC